MPTDYKGKIIHNMSQTKFNELLELNGGKLPAEFANSIVHTRAEDVNLSQLRTEVVYDMTSSDSHKNWGYHNGIQGGVTVSGKDFSKYKVLRVYVNYANTVTQIEDIDMNLLVDNKYFIAQRCGTQSTSNANFYFSNSYVNSSKSSFTHDGIGYISGTTVNLRNSNDDYIVYKIEGVLKEPSMIYTGAELHEGEGISIKDGIISTTNSNDSQVLLYSSSGVNSGTITLGDVSGYKFLSFVSLDANGVKTINVINAKAFASYVGLYSYDNLYVNITASGELTNKSFTITGVNGQSLSEVWGVK